MTHHHHKPPGQEGPAGNSQSPAPDKRARTRVTEEQRQQIVKLRRAGYGMRKIAERAACNRKTVRKVLQAAGLEQAPPPRPRAAVRSKLDGFKETIQELAEKGLKTPRILREIRELGFTGARTIVADYAHQFRPQRSPKKIRRRFETRPGAEMQIDWSPYRVPIAGKVRTVHAFSALLHYSRKAHVRFYENERESTLLEAHVHAFDDFRGVTQKLVYDNMATVVLGRIAKSGKPIWHPRLLDFAKHYGYEPLLCRVRDPDRKGGVEAIFSYLEHDFVAASSFESLDEMNARVRTWLDQVANARVHGTTRKVPDEEWLVERDLLIALPDAHFSTFDEELRQVDEDTTVWVRGTPYTVPWRCANKTVTVRLYHGHFEVLAPDGTTVALRRSYVSPKDKGKLQIDKSHFEGMPRRSGESGPGVARRLEDGLLIRFPTLADLVAGIKQRMKGLAHVHLRILSRLAARYGDEPFLHTGEQALELRSYNAHTVQRLLERHHPLPPAEPTTPLTQSRSLHEITDEVDSGSLEDYADLDQLDDDERGDHGQ
jgi:transposase